MIDRHSILLFFCLSLVLVPNLQGQVLLNGSFEGATIDCGIDLTNQAFSDDMPQVVGFGELGEPDILTGHCGLGPPQHGQYFVGLTARAGVTDAIALKLSEPLVQGQAYTIEFHEKLAFTNDPGARLSLGFTGPPTSHGELLHTVFELSENWKEHRYTFVSPGGPTYISVIVETFGEATVLVDNFTLTCPMPDLGPDLVFCDVPALTLQAGDFFNSYTWSDQSTASSMTIDLPGLYWVETELGDCVSRDSIVISEIAEQCACELYLPDAFSPNGDGTNDVWQPLTPCEFSDYDLKVFNRWGSMVFHSEDPNEAWNGKLGEDFLPTEKYVFRLHYRFGNDEGESQSLVEIVHLVR